MGVTDVLTTSATVHIRVGEELLPSECYRSGSCKLTGQFCRKSVSIGQFRSIGMVRLFLERDEKN